MLINSGSQAGCKLTLIAAPAGFGKTTAIRNWIQYSDRPVAWVSLEESDNEPVVFWMYVISALQTILAGFEAQASSKQGFGNTALLTVLSSTKRRAAKHIIRRNLFPSKWERRLYAV